MENLLSTFYFLFYNVRFSCNRWRWRAGEAFWRSPWTLPKPGTTETVWWSTSTARWDGCVVVKLLGRVGGEVLETSLMNCTFFLCSVPFFCSCCTSFWCSCGHRPICFAHWHWQASFLLPAYSAVAIYLQVPLVVLFFLVQKRAGFVDMAWLVGLSQFFYFLFFQCGSCGRRGAFR